MLVLLVVFSVFLIWGIHANLVVLVIFFKSSCGFVCLIGGCVCAMGLTGHFEAGLFWGGVGWGGLRGGGGRIGVVIMGGVSRLGWGGNNWNICSGAIFLVIREGWVLLGVGGLLNMWICSWGVMSGG